jgi:predicted nucleotidyltransferase
MLLRRPKPERVLQQVTEWAERIAPEHHGLKRVGVLGSYGRGDALARDSRWLWG